MGKINKQPIIVGIGEILWDNLPAGRQLGGAPANFAYHAKSLGANAFAVSCVGKDADGDEIRARVHALGVDGKCLAVDPAHPTGTVDVSLDEKGVPTFTIHQDVAWDYIPLTRDLLDLARRADALCFGSLAQRGAVSRRTIQAALEATRPDCLRIFDINLRQNYYSREIIEQSLRQSTVLKLNDQELPVVGRLLGIEGDTDTIARGCLDRYKLRLVALTCGGEGSSLYAASGASRHRGFPAKVVDTVGAGDSFTAAVAVGLLQGQSLDEINERANRLASYVCSQAGATPVIPATLKA